MVQRVGICIFAKPPVPGRVKTRIGTVVGHDYAAALAAALLHDIAAVVRSVPWAELVIAGTDTAGWNGGVSNKPSDLRVLERAVIEVRPKRQHHVER